MDNSRGAFVRGSTPLIRSTDVVSVVVCFVLCVANGIAMVS